MSMHDIFDGSDAHLLPASPAECADFLSRYNTWRRGDPEENRETEMPHPREVGINIDFAIMLIKQLDQLLEALEGLHQVCEIALSGKDGQQHTYFETRSGHFIEATKSMQAAESAIASVKGDQLSGASKTPEPNSIPAIVFYPAGSLGEEIDEGRPA